MNKVKQRYTHDTIDDSVHGDCWAACVASITEIPLEEVPDPNHPANKEWSLYWVNMWQFLQDRGWNMYWESVLEFKERNFPIIAIGKSPRGDFQHSIVWQGGIIHDPHPDNTGIRDIDCFEIIEKI